MLRLLTFIYLLYLHVASELRSWVLYYSFLVLHGILPDHHFTFYSLQVATKAEQILNRFYEMFATLYSKWSYVNVLGSEHTNVPVHNNTHSGEDGCTMNVHMLKCVHACMANWGPLWEYSCFHFESVNGLAQER